MASPVEKEVQLQPEQRTLVWRKNHGWVKCKTCNFCNGRCHIDDVGMWHYGMYYDSRHLWYCSLQCAAHRSEAYLRSLLTGGR